MNEQLQKEISDLQTQAEIFTNDLARIEGDEAQKGTYDALMAELVTVKGKITAKQAQVNEVQAAVQTNQTAMADSLTQIDLGDGETASIFDYTTTPEAAELLMAFINERIADITTQATVQAQAYQQELASKDAKITEWSDKYFAMGTDCDRFETELSDMTAKRDAAAAQLAEKDAEIERLKKENEDQRTSMVKPAATNTNANLKELAEKAKAARPKIYNLRWKDTSNRKTYVANDALTGDEMEFGYLSLGKYNVISEEEALQFRNEQKQLVSAPYIEEPANVEESPVLDSPLDDSAPVAPPFQGDSVAGLDPAVSGEPVDTKVETGTGTLEERVSRLEAAVFRAVKEQIVPVAV